MLGAASLSAAGVAHGSGLLGSGGGRALESADAAGVGLVCLTDAGFQAVVSTGELGTYPSASRALETLFDELDGGHVYTGPGRFPLGSPVTVPEGFRLSNLPGGMFVNVLSDATAKCLRFETDTGSDYLKLDCAGQNGVLFGRRNTGVDIDVGYLDVHRTGFDPGSLAAVEIRGSGVKIFHLDVYRGQRGLLLSDAYDVHVLSAVIANSGVGLRIDGAEHCFFDQMDFDSCRSYALRVDDASGILVDGLVWNNDSFDAWPYRNVEIGVNRPCDNVYTDLNHLSSAGTALFVGAVEGSYLRHTINESDPSARSHDAGIKTTAATDESCVIQGYVAPSISNPLTANGGTFDVQGAGTWRGTPSASADGSSTRFRISHGLGAAPTSIDVRPRSRPAARDFFVRESDESTIVVEYLSPPPSGDGNLVWRVELTV